MIDTIHLLGNAFIHCAKAEGKTMLSTSTLEKYKQAVEEYFVDSDIDESFEGTIETAVGKCKEFFEFSTDKKTISLKDNITINRLERRFVGYIPFRAAKAFSACKQIVLG